MSFCDRHSLGCDHGLVARSQHFPQDESSAQASHVCECTHAHARTHAHVWCGVMQMECFHSSIPHVCMNANIGMPCTPEPAHTDTIVHLSVEQLLVHVPKLHCCLVRTKKCCQVPKPPSEAAHRKSFQTRCASCTNHQPHARAKSLRTAITKMLL